MPTFDPSDLEKVVNTTFEVPDPKFKKSELDVDLDEQAADTERVELTTRDSRRYAPDGTAWCWFPSGALLCQNEDCQNKNHRRA
jgi:hypothetical protein